MRQSRKGWAHDRACSLLGVEDERVRRWRRRRERGVPLTDAAPGPVEAPHALQGWEREAVLKLIAQWGEVDRGHRKLAHRGSRLSVVHVSEATVLRIMQQEGIILPQRPVRDPAPRMPWPDWLIWEPKRLWCYDFTHESPHLEVIRDPGELEHELERIRHDYNSIRLHQGIGYVTPEDEHTGRGQAIRQARRDGLNTARIARLNSRARTT